MISLIMTFLLGLFCYSGVIDNRLNNLSLSDSIIEERELMPKGYGYLDEYGTQFYFTYADFYNGDFAKSILNNLESYYKIGLGFTNLADIYLPTSGSFYLMDGYVTSTKLADVSRIRIRKYQVDSATYEDSEYYIMHYSFTFLNSSDITLLQCTYIYLVPFLDQSAHDLGESIGAVSISNNNTGAGNGSLVYIENTLAGPTPYVTYGFEPNIERQGGYDAGYNNGYYMGTKDGYSNGVNDGYQQGYNVGYSAAAESDATASTIFTGILDVALIPVNVFLTIFNFEVFGINISGIVASLLTISVVIIIIRFVTGKKDD